MAFSIRDLFKGEEKKKAPTDTELLSVMNFSRPEIPVIRESRNHEWVSFGEYNNYPQQLIEYTDTSAIHNAIITQKSLMVAGSGFALDGVRLSDVVSNGEVYSKALNMISNGGHNLHKVVANLAMDYELFGAFALEVVWSMDFTRVVAVKHVDVSKLRSGKFNDDGEVDHHYWSRDWSSLRNNPPVKMQAFFTEAREGKQHTQVIYVRNVKPGFEYYGVPSYSGALSWIKIDSQLGKFHLSNIENGFNPSMTVKFYEKPGSVEERMDIMNAIKKQFGGVRNTGKAMVFFSDGKELSPDVEPINVQNLDKQFIVLAEQAVSQILSGHRVTSPELMGISVPGKLGTADLNVSYAIFNRTVVGPDRMVIENVLNEIAAVNGVTAEITLTEFNPLA